MVLAKSPAGFRIAREEMLQSVVSGMPPTAGAANAWLALELEKKPYVIITLEGDDDWGSGRLRGPFQAGFSYASRDASKKSAGGGDLVDPRARGLRRQRQALPGQDHRLPAGVRRFPHFGEVQVWDGMDGEKPWSKGQRARAIYDMSTPKLVGELAIDGDCKPLLVTDAAATPGLFTPTAADDAATAAAIAAFRKVGGYTTIQRDFVDDYEGKGPWTETPTVATHRRHPPDRRGLAHEGNGCGEFYGAMTAVFEDVGGKLKLLSAPDQGYMNVGLVIDLDADGRIELVADPDDASAVSGLYQSGPGGFLPVTVAEFPFNDCSC